MANTLVKESKILVRPFDPGREYNPGQPYLPERHAQVFRETYETMDYDEFVRKFVQTGAPYFHVSFSGSINVNSSTGERDYLQLSVTKYAHVGYQKLITVLLPRQKYIPPTPYRAPSPAQITEDLNIGWTGSATSKISLAGAGGFSFKVPISVAGAVVGLRPSGAGGSIKEIGWAAYFNGSSVSPMVRSVPLPSVSANSQWAEWSLWRDLTGEVSLLKDGETVFTFHERSFGTVELQASLYIAGDSVLDPSYLTYGEANVRLNPLKVSGGDSAYGVAYAHIKLPSLAALGGDGEYAIAEVTLPSLFTGPGHSNGTVRLPKLHAVGLASSAFPGWVQRPELPPSGLDNNVAVSVGAVLLPKVACFGYDQEYQVGYSVLPALIAFGETGLPTPSYGAGGVYLPKFQTQGHSLVGTVGDGEIALPPVAAKGSEGPYGEGGVMLSQFTVAAQYAVIDQVDVIQTALAMSNVVASQGEVIAYMLSVAQANFSAGLISVAAVEFRENAQASVTLQGIAEMLAEMLAYAYGVTPLPEPEAEAFAWAATEQGGMVTRYSGYNFQSFAEIAGQHYGVRADGLFLLEGTDDADVPISAELAFGGTDFGSAALKHLPNVYVGVKATDGRLFLKVDTAQGEFTYEARRSDERMATQRFDLGRGLRDNWFEFTLIAEDVAAFELDNIEFKPIASKRRI